MKVTAVEVKTFYTVQFTLDDFVDALVAYSKDKNHEKTIYPKAFDTMNLESCEDISLFDIQEILRNDLRNTHGETYFYLAKYFGYDGWDNAGYWVERDGVYRMVVFNYGDTIKK